MTPDLDRALGYPYFIPKCSYIYHAPSYTLLDTDDKLPSLEKRTPVLAIGSNQSPEQLARKFPYDKKNTAQDIIPVTKAYLDDFDTVYSPHIAGYGSVPATLHPSPGTTVTVFVNWLNQSQLEGMHETELTAANYSFGKLKNIHLDIDRIGLETSVFYYHGTRGALALDGEPVALSTVDAKNRRHKTMDQRQINRLVQQRFRPHLSHSEFLKQLINDQGFRKHATDFLSQLSISHDPTLDYFSSI